MIGEEGGQGGLIFVLSWCLGVFTIESEVYKKLGRRRRSSQEVIDFDIARHTAFNPCSRMRIGATPADRNKPCRQDVEDDRLLKL